MIGKLAGILLVLGVGALGLGATRLMVASEGDQLPLVGDLNCDGSVDPVDALTILRYDAGLGTGLPQGCPSLGNGGHPVSSAINDLAMRLGVVPSSIVVLEVREVGWGDPCLGVYENEACLAIPIGGYWIRLGASGEDYEYRTDCSGEIIRAVDFVGPGASVEPAPDPAPGACG